MDSDFKYLLMFIGSVMTLMIVSLTILGAMGKA